MSQRNRAKGVAIAVTAVACVTPDAMLLRWARLEGATAWQTAFWKMNIVGLLNLCSALYLTGGLGALLKGIKSDPLALGIASLVQVGDQLGFTFSFLTNETARAMLFISLNPVWAALLGCFFLGDQLPKRTLGLLGAGILSTAIVFVPSLLETQQPSSNNAPGSPTHQPVTLLGDVVSLATGLCLASYVTFIRYCSKFRPTAAIDAAPSFGNFLAAGVALIMSRVVGSGVTDGIQMDIFLPVVAANALLVAIFYVGFTLSPRYITGAEVALILLMETVFGPIWVFLRFGDVPSPWTIAGGAVLVCALAVHEVLGMYSGAARTSHSDASAIDLATTSPVVRLAASPPPPQLHVTVAPGGNSVYNCFSDGGRAHPGKG